ncbi:class I SAM-dependent methyltransferase [Paenibacillus solanacearum]|nr:SAM-dependent methyltransferase [Paenibacillus solanacearum]
MNSAMKDKGLGLREAIEQEIAATPERAISFRRYMELCLYHPFFGYYMRPEEKIGREGDFYTSASIGSLLAETIAEWIVKEPFWDAGSADGIRIVEWGGGSGKLAQQLLDALQTTAPELYARLDYISVEASGYHRELQSAALAAHAKRLRFLTAEAWYGAGPWDNTLVLSNELPDAFPVHRIAVRDGRWVEKLVSWDEQRDKPAETERPLSDEAVLAYINEEQLPCREGQQFEVNLAASDWMRSVAAALGQGAVLTIDYGDVGEELYAPHRMNGTLLCYRKHLASDTPLQHPGEQDMTAHVNFGALIRAGERGGLGQAELMTQKQFLVRNGLLQRLQSHDARDPFSPEARRNRAIRQLLLTDQMSELFKVLIQKKEPSS